MIKAISHLLILPFLFLKLPSDMVDYKTVIKKFDKQGEKTGWIAMEKTNSF